MSDNLVLSAADDRIDSLLLFLQLLLPLLCHDLHDRATRLVRLLLRSIGVQRHDGVFERVGSDTVATGGCDHRPALLLLTALLGRVGRSVVGVGKLGRILQATTIVLVAPHHVRRLLADHRIDFLRRRHLPIPDQLCAARAIICDVWPVDDLFATELGRSAPVVPHAAIVE